MPEIKRKTIWEGSATLYIGLGGISDGAITYIPSGDGGFLTIRLGTYFDRHHILMYEHRRHIVESYRQEQISRGYDWASNFVRLGINTAAHAAIIGLINGPARVQIRAKAEFEGDEQVSDDEKYLVVYDLEPSEVPLTMVSYLPHARPMEGHVKGWGDARIITASRGFVVVTDADFRQVAQHTRRDDLYILLSNSLTTVDSLTEEARLAFINEGILP